MRRITPNTVRITEQDIVGIVAESLERILGETSAIRQWTDDDYLKVNPTQRNDIDFGSLKQSDDEFNDKHGLTGDDARKSGEQFSNLSGFQKKAIDKLQNDLTRNVQQRYMDATGSEEPVIRGKELGKIGGQKLKAELLKNGLRIGISGKTFAYGNLKLPENIMVINLTSAFNCPAALNGECAFGKTCYGVGGERRLPSLQLRNLRNQNAFRYLSTKEILKLIEAYIEAAPVRIKYIRISEEGDFKDQETVDFCDKIAGHLKAKYGIQTVAYTHRVLDYSNVKNMIINASSYRINTGDRYFITVSEDEWEKVPDGLDLSGYKMDLRNAEPPHKKVDTTHGTFKCHCDCRQCMFCYRTKQENGEPDDNMITVIETFRK